MLRLPWYQATLITMGMLIGQTWHIVMDGPIRAERAAGPGLYGSMDKHALRL